HDLAAIRGVREDLLISAHVRGEHDFGDSSGEHPVQHTTKQGSVLEEEEPWDGQPFGHRCYGLAGAGVAGAAGALPPGAASAGAALGAAGVRFTPAAPGAGCPVAGAVAGALGCVKA